MIIHDTEIYPNAFVLVTKDTETKEINKFQISPIQDDRHKIIQHLKKQDIIIGFYSLLFDCPLIQFFITKLYPKNYTAKEIVHQLKLKANELGENLGKPWNNQVKIEYRKQLDLFKIHHFDNTAKMTSLKQLEFVFKMKNVQELPFRYDKILTNNEIEELIEYCINDVEATFIFYEKSIPHIEFRNRMTDIYGMDFSNTNDVKIGEMILLKTFAEKEKTPLEEILKLRTYRYNMPIKDIIFDYIKFYSIELNTFLSWWKSKTITQTKGQFSELELSEVEPILPYCNNTLKKGKLKKLNIIYKGFQFDLGTGGLHGIQKVGIFETDSNHKIYLLDVSSYYPNLAAENWLHPEHFAPDIFVDVIKTLYEQRMEAKAKGDNQMVKAIKLALNGALYGKSNSEYSAMYDPLFMMTICLNGQLLLMMIAEKCLDNNIEIIQVNTDGIIVKCHNNKKATLDLIVQKWMQLTSLKLELEEYTKLIQRDVNNYLAIKTDGKLKRKGVFVIDREFHQNHSQLVVPKAIEEYYTKGTLPEIFIENHIKNDKNLYDFFKLCKLQRNYSLLARTEFTKILEYPAKRGKKTKKYPIKCITTEIKLQNITRYYVAKQGYNLIKLMPPLKDKIFNRENEIEAGFLTMECNNLNNITPKEVRDNINKDYYIQECYKIINAISEGIELEEDE